MQYSECLPKIQRTCATLYSVESFSTDVDGGECFPGCHCPSGKLLHAGECVKPNDCPCQYQKKFYSAGHVVKIDCNYWSVCCLFSFIDSLIILIYHHIYVDNDI